MPLLKKCAICEQDFYLKPSHYDKIFCCSKWCSSQRMKITMIGENNPHYKNLPPKQCLRCGKDYHSYNKNRKYCGDDCANISNRKNPDESHHQKWEKNRKKKREEKEEKRRLRKLEILEKYGEVKKIFHKCKKCFQKKSLKRNILCTDCKPKTKRVITTCRACEKEVISWPCRIKIYCSNKCYTRDGHKNPNYRGGINDKNRAIRNSKAYKLWRIAVYTRDNYTCNFCGQLGGKLNADHIKPFSTHPHLRLDISNGRTLCIECHKKTPTYHGKGCRLSRKQAKYRNENFS